jgi:general secretion pathway protein N
VKRRTGWLIALGLLAVLAFALATLPAAVLSGSLARAGLATTSLSGSIWSGTAHGLAWRDATLGDLTWTLAPARLLSGRAAGHGRLVRADGTLDTDFDVALFGDDLRLGTTTFELPVEALEALPLGLPKGWRGRAKGAFDEVHVRDRWPVALRGTLDLDGLVAPAARDTPLGNFQVRLPHPQPQPSLSVPADERNLTAQVRDRNGTFAVDGQLTLGPTRNFSLEGTIAPRGPVPPSLDRALQLLGPADAAGRRQFSVGGSL